MPPSTLFVHRAPPRLDHKLELCLYNVYPVHSQQLEGLFCSYLRAHNWCSIYVTVVLHVTKRFAPFELLLSDDQRRVREDSALARSRTGTASKVFFESFYFESTGLASGCLPSKLTNNNTSKMFGMFLPRQKHYTGKLYQPYLPTSRPDSEFIVHVKSVLRYFNTFARVPRSISRISSGRHFTTTQLLHFHSEFRHVHVLSTNLRSKTFL